MVKTSQINQSTQIKFKKELINSYIIILKKFKLANYRKC